jgi:hypothetical protein
VADKTEKAPKAERAPKAEKAPKKAAANGEQHLDKEASRDEKKCREKDCKHHYRAKGYCVKHYRLWRQHKLGKKQRYKICTKEGCRKPRVKWGLCDEHYKADAGIATAAEAPAAAPAAE